MLAILGTTFALSISLGFASPLLEQRATTTCNSDNLLRCLRSSAIPASAYCSSYLGASVTTVTTVTPITTVSSTTVGTENDLATSVITETAFTTVVVTTTFTESRFTTATLTSGVTTTAPAVQKRVIEVRQVAASGPRCVSYNGASTTSYAPSRISSACSCIGITGGPVSSVTATAPAATVTSIIASTTTITSTVLTTLTATSTLSSTEVNIETSLSTIFTTATSYTAVVPTCTIVDGGGNIKFTRYFKGSGTTENLRNPGNTFQYRPAQSTLIPAQPACSAAVTCAQYLNAIRDYYSFDLHYLVAQNVYECRAFYDRNRDPAYFDQASSNIGDSYGYSF